MCSNSATRLVAHRVSTASTWTWVSGLFRSKTLISCLLHTERLMFLVIMHFYWPGYKVLMTMDVVRGHFYSQTARSIKLHTDQKCKSSIVYNYYIPFMNAVGQVCRHLGHSWPTLYVFETQVSSCSQRHFILYIFAFYFIWYILRIIFYLYLLQKEISFMCS